MVIITIAVGGIWYIKKGSKSNVDPTISVYNNANLGMSFSYPKILTLSEASGEITLHHEVSFVHRDFCDFKGEGTTTMPTLTDFNVKLHIVNKNIVDTMRAESPYIPAENFVNDNIITSPGFIDSFQSGNLKGFKIFEGAEGCGQTIYYLKVTNSKTIVIRNDLITVFTGAIDAQNEAAAEAVPNVINKQKSEVIFNSIIETLKVR